MIPDKGDIIHLEFDPASGKELKGRHFCLVVSSKAFNQRFQLAMVCPISGGMAAVAREAGFLISLTGAGTRTDGTIHAHQLKSLDFVARKARFIERAPIEIVNQVTDCILSVLEE